MLALALCLGVVLSGCATPARLPPPSIAEAQQAPVLGIPNARFRVTDTAALTQEFAASIQREADARQREGVRGDLPPAAYLAISGGGDDGAYGAGLLVGWTTRGDRPTFKGVTGVSTGALSAPFAFLGPEYDEQLKAVYTTSPAGKIFKRRGVLAGLTNDAVSDTAPLRAMVENYVDDRMIARISEEYAKGRLLLIMTTNLDAGEPCIWNIGAIAAGGAPGARELIVNILLASAAVPAVFPPVMFDFEANGVRRQEMHADGGVFGQAFLYPAGISAVETEKLSSGAIGRKRDAYIIRNGRTHSETMSVPRKTLRIAGRAVSLMILSSGMNDMFRMYALANRDRVGFHLTYIPDEFKEPYKGPFDQGYMSTLFQFGFEQGRSGKEWRSEPPGWAH